MSGKSAAKGQTWSDSEVVHLLTLWAQPEVQGALDTSVRNRTIYSKLARQLTEAGYPPREGEACRNKVNRVRRNYRQIRDEGRKSGQGREDDLPMWYDIIEAVDGKKPKTCPIAVLDSSSTSPSTSAAGEPRDAATPASSASFCSDNDTCPPPPDDERASAMLFDTDNPVDLTDDGTDRDLDEQYLRETVKDEDRLEPDDSPSDKVLSGNNSFIGGDDTDTTDVDHDEQDKKVTGKGEKGKNTSKRKVDKSAKSLLVAALHTSKKEMKEDMESMEKRQRMADEKAMQEERQERERERQRRLEVEERWRREDRENAQRAQREERDFRLAIMSMMQQQTSLLGRLLNEDQSMAQRPHRSDMYMQQPPPLHDQMPQQSRTFTPQQAQPNHMSEPHRSSVPQPSPFTFMPEQTLSECTPQQPVNSCDPQHSSPDQGMHQEERKEYYEL